MPFSQEESRAFKEEKANKKLYKWIHWDFRGTWRATHCEAGALRPNFDSNCTAHLLHSFFVNSIFEAYLGMVNVMSQRIFGIIKQNFHTMSSMKNAMQWTKTIKGLSNLLWLMLFVVQGLHVHFFTFLRGCWSQSFHSKLILVHCTALDISYQCAKSQLSSVKYTGDIVFTSYPIIWFTEIGVVPWGGVV